ncbi:unnamed protein product [Amoebophrya sp. A120]|nr:unnamed protein product [Amoebophrya sp. A120]|eukprot:GSA120T00015282001.1
MKYAQVFDLPRGMIEARSLEVKCAGSPVHVCEACPRGAAKRGRSCKPTRGPPACVPGVSNKETTVGWSGRVYLERSHRTNLEDESLRGREKVATTSVCNSSGSISIQEEGKRIRKSALRGASWERVGA